MKKGVLFTISTFLIAIILLLLAILIYRASLETEERFAEGAVINKVQDLYTSIDESIRAIFMASETIGVEIIKVADNTYDVRFTDRLGKAKDQNYYGQDFYEKLEEFAEFVSQDVEINLSALNMNEIIQGQQQSDNDILKFIIKPFNIEYLHKLSGGNMDIRIRTPAYNQIDFKGISIEIDTGEKEVTDIKVQPSTPGSGETAFNITAKGSPGTQIWNGNLNFLDSTSFQIEMRQTSPITIDIDGDSNTKVIMRSTASKFEPSVNTTLHSLVVPEGEEIEVTFPEELVRITEAEFEISKIYTPSITI